MSVLYAQHFMLPDKQRLHYLHAVKGQERIIRLFYLALGTLLQSRTISTIALPGIFIGTRMSS
ncbi:hypothetical protein B0X71_19145 (plasmid) [Planococcus lenghuensis]|uniref:Uncharacterized protein n=1 Tax=Planococcus lenghuensis TaxID=2213202 RepID=A0A1Q2L4A9_9BACL|nr:hypothetical protein B0X71_19145 [Planococcus lenghuensis]